MKRNTLPVSHLEEGHHFADDELVLFRPIALEGEQIGTVYIKCDLAELHSRLKRYASICTVVMVFSIFVAYLLSSKFQRVISEPILHLAKTMKAVSEEKKYSVRAEKKSSDELGILIDGFNEMLTQIQVRDGKLKQHRDQLENEVSLRTAELSRINQNLEQAVQQLKEAKEAAKSSTGDSSTEIDTISEKKEHTVKKILAIDTVKEAGLELKRGNTQTAIDLLEPVLNDDPNNAMALAIRAYAYSRIGDQDKALSDIDRALKLKPNAPKALLLKGSLLLRQGNASGAVDTLSKAIKIDSDCGRCYLLRGKALNQLNQYRKAYHNFKKACQKGESKGCEKVRAMEAKRKEKKQPQKRPRQRY